MYQKALASETPIRFPQKHALTGKKLKDRIYGGKTLNKIFYQKDE